MTMLALSVLTPPTALRAAIALVVLLPLLLTVSGLWHGRRAVVLLVVYIGGTSVEVVAQSGGMPVLSAALLAAVLELGMLLALISRRVARE